MNTWKAIIVAVVAFLIDCAIVAAIGVDNVPVWGIILLWLLIGCVISAIVTKKK